MTSFIRKDTANHYRNVRKILKGSQPEPQPSVLLEDDKHVFSATMFGLCFLIARLMLVASCKVAHAEDINLDVIADIESSNEPLAYNKDSGAVGEYQLTAGVVRDWNNHHDEYKLEDMYIEGLAHQVANWYLNEEIPNYLRVYDIPDTISSRIIAWSWGIGHLRKWFKRGSYWNQLPYETQRYIQEYYKEIK